MRTDAAEIVGDTVAAKLDEFWGMNEEGELRGLAVPIGRKCWRILYHHKLTTLCRSGHMVFRRRHWLCSIYVTILGVADQGRC